MYTPFDCYLLLLIRDLMLNLIALKAKELIAIRNEIKNTFMVVIDISPFIRFY